MKVKVGSALVIALLLVISLGNAPVAHAACDDPYTVEAGDTLVSIAQACGVDNYIVLMDINPELENPNLLHPGQVIRLTAEVPLPFQPATGLPVNAGMQPGGVYIVRAGDALAKIAYMYNTTVTALYQANPQLGGRPIIYPGQRLQMPWDARLSKGWVGVSENTAMVNDDIVADIRDFPAYTDVDFVLRLYWEKVYGPDGKDQFDPSTEIIADGKTDARGRAQAILTVPYYAAVDIGLPYVVEVYTSESPQRITAYSAEIIICTRAYDFDLGQYVTSCTAD